MTIRKPARLLLVDDDPGLLKLRVAGSLLHQLQLTGLPVAPELI